MADTKEDQLLKILQSHGEQFLSSFSFPEQTFKSRKRKRTPEIISAQKKSSRLIVDEKESDEEEDEDDEWGGIIEHSTADGDEDLDIQPENEQGILRFHALLQHC
jgi:hypothetical protein